jgi:hypothetical protein
LVEPVVDRWVEQPPDRIEAVLGDPSRLPIGTPITVDGGRGLVIVRPFARVAQRDRQVSWKAPGRLLMQGTGLVRFARVEVEIIVWSDERSEVTVRRRGREIVTWSDARERRFFANAHRAAAHLARVLSTRDILAASRVRGRALHLR